MPWLLTTEERETLEQTEQLLARLATGDKPTPEEWRRLREESGALADRLEAVEPVWMDDET